MDTRAAQAFAEQAIADHGLEGWTFRWTNAKNQFGVCRYLKQEIGLSKPLTQLNPFETVKNTILHEIAHALAGRGKGHGPEWKAVCRQIGAAPDRCYDGELVAQPPARFQGECGHGCTFQRHRKTDRMYRLICTKHVEQIVWTENPVGR